MKRQPANTANAVKILSLCGSALLVAGCVETTPQPAPEAKAPPRINMVRREGVSPGGATVAITDIQGVPAGVSANLSRAFEAQARDREIRLTGQKTANYLVRGYMSMSPAEGGATFAFVWDVYDSKKRRAQRIDDSIFVKGATAVPEAIDDAALNQIAGKSADDLAAVLTNMPEAVAAANILSAKTVSAARAPAPDGGTTTVAETPAVAGPSPQAAGVGIAAADR